MKTRKIRCKNCGNYFYPDSFNRHHQKYCSRTECRKASHRASSSKYRKKKSSDSGFLHKESERVKKWQCKNPDYWKKGKKTSKKILKNQFLRDFAQVEKLNSEVILLRDFTNLQYSVIKGVISTLTGNVLRDDITDFVRQMYNKGCEVSGGEPEKSFSCKL